MNGTLSITAITDLAISHCLERRYPLHEAKGIEFKNGFRQDNSAARVSRRLRTKTRLKTSWRQPAKLLGPPKSK
jgi:elongation factor P--beta-lysine ligase